MGSGSSTCPRTPPSFSPPSTCGLSSTSRSQTSPSRLSPISNAPPQSAASFSMAISSASVQTSTGGPSRPSRANQPDSVSVAGNPEARGRQCADFGLSCPSQSLSERETERDLEIKSLATGQKGSNWRSSFEACQITLCIGQSAAATRERAGCINGEHPLGRGSGRPPSDGSHERHRGRHPIRVDLLKPRFKRSIVRVEPHLVRHRIAFPIPYWEAVRKQSFAVLRPESLTGTRRIRIRLLPAGYRTQGATPGKLNSVVVARDRWCGRAPKQGAPRSKTVVEKKD